MDGRTDNSAQRAFFGRRKGHPLRPRQAALFDTLLPKLALDLDQARAGRSARACSRSVDDVRLEIGFGGAEHLIAQAQAPSAHRLHRQRRLRQRHRQGARGHRRRQARQYPPASRRRQRADRLAAGGIARAHRPALSRSVAEAAALEAALHPGREPRAPGAHPRQRRRIALRHRHSRLRRLDAGARAALEGFCLDRRTRRRLAQAWAGFSGTRYEAKAKREGRAPAYFIFRKRNRVVMPALFRGHPRLSCHKRKAWTASGSRP